MSYKSRVKRVQQSFGKCPDVEYYTGDMEHIRSYYEAQVHSEPDRFYIDSITWNDLDMDAVFKRINTGLSTTGEQYLYYMLHRPMTQPEFEHQQALIQLVNDETETRCKLQQILCRIGRYRPVDLTGILNNQYFSPLWLAVYSFLALLFPLSLILTLLFGKSYLWLLLASLIVNGLLHEYRTHRCEREIQTVNYCVGLVQALHHTQKMRHPILDKHLANTYPHLAKLRSLLRIGPVLPTTQNDITSMIMTVLLLDLIFFELLKKRLAKHHAHFSATHEAIGQLDAAIAIASWRQSMECWSQPIIDFEAANAFLHAEAAEHPLLENPVANDVTLLRSLLITGANASGKSTYLKAVILCALLAQTTCTAPCASYHASNFRIYTSIAISDSIRDGESYYIAEIRSLKRILDAQCIKTPILCAIDEVLRGTNTIERIAASTEVLKALSTPHTLCLAATHDAELCELVADAYDLAHFQETITDSDIQFDYRIKPGKATSRNAINLLRLMGFPDDMVQAAHSRADAYLHSGQWKEETSTGGPP
ncbi:MAG: hypothetical protein J6K73_03220 [Clostridia bacterium]|nr:hypothetical protein [Clostridia bacterium]